MSIPKVAVQTPSLDGVSMTRCYLPYNHLHQNNKIELVPKWELYRAHIAVFHRHYDQDALEAIRDARRRGIKVLTDIDDDLFNLARTNPAYAQYASSNYQTKLKTLLQELDLIVVSTPDLAKKFGVYNKTHVVPNGLDFQNVWLPLPASIRQKVTIGYTGSTSHAGDFDFLKGLFRNLHRRYGSQIRWVFMGHRPPWLQDELPDFEFYDWVSTPQYPNAVRQLGIDIGLAPLVYNEFNLAKSNLKFLEYASIGAAFVGSDIGPYKTIPQECGFLLKNKKEAWEKTISRLIEHPELRIQSADRAQAYALANYGIDKTSEPLYEALQSLNPDLSLNASFVPYLPQDAPGAVDVIIPVYNSREKTEACLKAIIQDLGPSDRLLVMDDASTDPGLETLYSSLAQDRRVQVHRNEENQGYLKNVNLGLRLTSRDVIIMNSDIIPMPGLVSRLKQSAYSYSKIGIVSPITDHGTIASFPSYSDAPALVKHPDLTNHPLIWSHTACGYCMYIKARVFEDYGLFDESYGFGYWEENEFSARIREKYLCAFDPGAFVYHANSSSVDDQTKQDSSAANYKKFSKAYPEYFFQQTCFYHSRPFETVRKRLAASTQDPRPRVLFVAHSLTALGGTEKHMKDLAAAFKDLAHVFIAFPDQRTASLIVNYHDIDQSMRVYYTPAYPVAPDELPKWERAWNDVLEEVRPDLIHVHHLLHHPLNTLAFFQKNHPTVVSFHDSFAVCPDPHLSNCPGTNSCASCLPTHFQQPVSIEYQNHRRQVLASALQKAQALIAPSEYTASIIKSVYPDLNIDVIPHGIQPLAHQYAPSTSLPLKVGYFGTLSPKKGLFTLIRAFEQLFSENRPIELHLHGAPPFGRDAKLEQFVQKYASRVHYHGAYVPSQLNSLVKDIDVAVIPSTVPESFCYVLSELHSAKVPVIASNIGALSSRIQHGINGYLFTPDNHLELISLLREIVQCPQALSDISKNISAPETLEQTAQKIFTLYSSILIKNTCLRT